MCMHELQYPEGEDNRKLASYIYDCMGKKGRNDLERLTWRERYGSEVRQVKLCQKWDYHLPVTSIITIVIHSSITSLLVFQCCNSSSTQQPTSKLKTAVHMICEKSCYEENG